ncbi:TPA: two-component sensor histidine kinase BarA [Salmonella enterica]|uniref:histidine kinase n=1 Tax=Salmonella enterica subsp. enterica serovar Typhi str. 404ty TaxID=497977 RepID=A0A719WKR4_SALTI|nr:two-component sensor histidine kinase BarA [Salmonella enterica subsp. enterica serovar Typhi]HAD5342429.1 two-component sensor histidine kinase BarA [Salmonella enterica subsp. enterica serovar Typhi str. CT18]HAD7387315.1 two-component sensor histidine kinase BarA [Salmonella enterica subsp. enterica serovar Typhi str. 404ty]HAD7449643.1 two-component sensor histidine kinase BarA [Salmonella enterica subsp. enterica serovar Typhi str. 404ty]HAO4087675.1 two-component sensor histidine kinas
MHRYNDLQRQLEDAGASIIEPLAVSSEYGMNLQNRESIGQLISVLHRRHSDIVRAISVYDDHNRLFVTSNFHLDPSQMQLPAGAPFPRRLSVDRHGDIMILRTPIISESYSPDESAIADAKNTKNMLGYVALELDLKSVRLQQYKEIFISSVMMLFCIGIALIFGWRLMRDVTGPIRNMVNTVDRIRRGQLDSRVEGFMLGELDMLKNGINSMAMSLAAYHEEMQHNIDQATSDLRETLEQMEIQNVELDLAKKRAQEAARIKSEFLANMSHELRTPLNGVIGFTRLTLKTELNPTQRDHLNTIERSANNLLAIINDVLDFSKLEAGKLILESIPFPLRNTLDEVVTLLAHSSHDKGLELTLNIKNDVPENVIGDPLRLQQVITNLVGNAIKFTESGNIDILVEKRALSNTKVQIEVQIRDTGIGIPERDQSRLFQAFRQADASISRRHGGTGLGLVITQKLVNEMGGDISFHSQPNRGSTFWFHINLDLNPNVIIDGPSTACLAGKRLAYIEPNATAAQCTLDLLSDTPVEVIYSPTFSALPLAHYDIMILSVPVTFREPLTMQHERLAKAASMTDFLLLALPCHAQINAEKLKQGGAAACLLKPLTSTRLLPALTEYCQLNHHPEPLLMDTSKITMTVMAVDDNPANLKLIGALLEDKVQHVELCDSGHQAVDRAKQMQFDLILMDIQMPDMDGIRACELIHQLPHQQQTPVIAVTAHAMAGQKEKLLSAGMNDYLAKPIEEEKLHNLLLRYKPGANVAARLMAPEPAEFIFNPNATLDWQLALRQAAGKPDLARDMLQMLIDFLPEVRNKIEEQLVGENPNGLVDLVHKLHGSCGYSGVPRMKNLCQLIEQQLRSGVHEEELEPEFLELLDEMDNVAREAKKILG